MKFFESLKNNNNSFTNLKIIPVILAGGSGSRLWPLSRSSFPKQFLTLDHTNPYSFLQKTFLRLNGLENIDQPIVICNEAHRFIVAEQLRELKISPKSILLEPEGKNTAPAITLASLIANKTNLDDVLLLVLSSDQEIDDSKNFVETINKARKEAERGRIITFGVPPKRAETGYGYIKSFEELTEENSYSLIDTFIEKPNKDLAKKFIKEKKYTWNSGIFLFKKSLIINQIKTFTPEILSICKDSLNEDLFDLDFQRLKKESFKKCPSISIDKAVMERTNLGTVFLLDAGWNDIGSWNSLWDKSPKDKNGNSSIGRVITKNTKNCYLRSESRLIVTNGIKDLIVIETSDALLILDKDSSQEVRSLVEEMKNNSIPEAINNKKTFRPWGSYSSVLEDSSFQVKSLEIKPQESISLQLHKFRSEHWIVVRGTAQVEIDQIKTLVYENESIYVPLGSKHRLSNPGNENLIIIEVQSGTYLGEDDIQRFEDKYGRVEEN